MKSLHADTATKVISIPALFISFQSACSFQSHSVESKLYPLEAASCNGKNFRWLAFRNDVKECGKFSFYITKKDFKTNYHFHYNNKCLIYVNSCKVCSKQNGESTTDRFCFLLE